jgi:hypothetical protein
MIGWLIGKIMALAGSGVVQKVLDVYNSSQNTTVKLAEVAAGESATRTAAQVTLQSQKMNWPVFWIIIAVMLGAPAWQLWGVTLYNTFWHANGIWPQAWTIAAYPPSVAPWVNASIEWLYNPIGVPGTVASAWLAGRVSSR